MESVNEVGEGGEGNEVKRGSRVSEGRHHFYINHEIFKTFFDMCTVQSLRYLKAAVGLCPKRETEFLSKIQLSEKSGQLSIWYLK